MCETCYNGRPSPIVREIGTIKKEITFTAPTGDHVNYCVDCYNHEFEHFENFYCEECNQFHNRSEINHEEVSSKYLCNACYYEFCKINCYKGIWED